MTRLHATIRRMIGSALVLGALPLAADDGVSIQITNKSNATWTLDNLPRDVARFGGETQGPGRKTLAKGASLTLSMGIASKDAQAKVPGFLLTSPSGRSLGFTVSKGSAAGSLPTFKYFKISDFNQWYWDDVWADTTREANLAAVEHAIKEAKEKASSAIAPRLDDRLWKDLQSISQTLRIEILKDDFPKDSTATTTIKEEKH